MWVLYSILNTLHMTKVCEDDFNAYLLYQPLFLPVNNINFLINSI